MSEKSKEFAFQLDQMKKRKNVPTPDIPKAQAEPIEEEGNLTFRGNSDAP
jgi:hypothetical protein